VKAFSPEPASVQRPVAAHPQNKLVSKGKKYDADGGRSVIDKSPEAVHLLDLLRNAVCSVHRVLDSVRAGSAGSFSSRRSPSPWKRATDHKCSLPPIVPAHPASSQQCMLFEHLRDDSRSIVCLGTQVSEHVPVLCVAMSVLMVGSLFQPCSSGEGEASEYPAERPCLPSEPNCLCNQMQVVLQKS